MDWAGLIEGSYGPLLFFFCMDRLLTFRSVFIFLLWNCLIEKERWPTSSYQRFSSKCGSYRPIRRRRWRPTTRHRQKIWREIRMSCLNESHNLFTRFRMFIWKYEGFAGCQEEKIAEIRWLCRSGGRLRRKRSFHRQYGRGTLRSFFKSSSDPRSYILSILLTVRRDSAGRSYNCTRRLLHQFRSARVQTCWKTIRHWIGIRVGKFRIGFGWFHVRSQYNTCHLQQKAKGEFRLSHRL